ncbi:hypothetical protein F511_08824 [Dorcoceras hygrometricum]|uniref:Uncharacterized protein n=1 Tax=Dorcoceras hygrometricum TaxID=472368 RepID=A0A2Z7ABQ9_9LAMI|nr:hypothetical protein F511_08824 [Dorcoceras hygrometricum]
MQHGIIDAMKCMRAIKDRIARPVYQLEIISVSLYTRTVYQPGKSSVRDLQSPSAHHSSVIITKERQFLPAQFYLLWSRPTTTKFLEAEIQKLKLVENYQIPLYEETSNFVILSKIVLQPQLGNNRKKTHKESSATKFIQNNDGKRRQ